MAKINNSLTNETPENNGISVINEFSYPNINTLQFFNDFFTANQSPTGQVNIGLKDLFIQVEELPTEGIQIQKIYVLPDGSWNYNSDGNWYSIGNNGNQNLAEVLTIGGREIKLVSASYLLESTDKNKYIVLDGTDINITLTDIFENGDEIIIDNSRQEEPNQILFNTEELQVNSFDSPILIPAGHVVHIIRFAPTVYLLSFKFSGNIGSQDLQSITDAGNATTNQIVISNSESGESIIIDGGGIGFMDASATNGVSLISDNQTGNFGTVVIKDAGETTKYLAFTTDIPTTDTTPTDGSTNPVQSNGVFDSLNLKANKTQAFKKIIKITNNTTITSGTTETLLETIPFSANEVAIGDVFSILVMFSKLSGSSIAGTIRLRASQTDFASSTIISTYTSGTTLAEHYLQRESFRIKTGNSLTGFSFSTNSASDLLSSNIGESSMTIDPTQAWNLYITIQSNNSSATFGIRTAKIIVI